MPAIAQARRNPNRLMFQTTSPAHSSTKATATKTIPRISFFFAELRFLSKIASSELEFSQKFCFGVFVILLVNIIAKANAIAENRILAKIELIGKIYTKIFPTVAVNEAKRIANPALKLSLDILQQINADKKEREIT